MKFFKIATALTLILGCVGMVVLIIRLQQPIVLPPAPIIDTTVQQLTTRIAEPIPVVTPVPVVVVPPVKINHAIVVKQPVRSKIWSCTPKKDDSTIQNCEWR